MNKNILKSCLINQDEDVITLVLGKPYNFNYNTMEMSFIEKEIEEIQNEIGYRFKKFVNSNQKHTKNVAIVDEQNLNDEFLNTDGLVTNLKGVAIAMKVADCQAIMLYDPIKKVIGNVHSGWKGTLQKIVVEAVNTMQSRYGCNPKDIKAYISPSICQDCFEVDKDVYDQFIREYNNIDFALKHGKTIDNKPKYYIDTVALNIKNLVDLGVKKENIETSNICTKCNSNKFHSYRAEHENSGRNVAIICMK